MFNTAKKMQQMAFHDEQAEIAESHQDWDTASYHYEQSRLIAESISEDEFNDYLAAHQDAREDRVDE